MPKAHHSTLAKFRCGVAPLNIELGRYCGTPLERRLSLACSNDAIEDEIHILVECPAYDDDVRKYLMDLAANTLPDFEILN